MALRSSAKAVAFVFAGIYSIRCIQWFDRSPITNITSRENTFQETGPLQDTALILETVPLSRAKSIFVWPSCPAKRNVDPSAFYYAEPLMCWDTNRTLEYQPMKGLRYFDLDVVQPMGNLHETTLFSSADLGEVLLETLVETGGSVAWNFTYQASNKAITVLLLGAAGILRRFKRFFKKLLGATTSRPKQPRKAHVSVSAEHASPSREEPVAPTLIPTIIIEDHSTPWDFTGQDLQDNRVDMPRDRLYDMLQTQLEAMEGPLFFDFDEELGMAGVRYGAKWKAAPEWEKKWKRMIQLAELTGARFLGVDDFYWG